MLSGYRIFSMPRAKFRRGSRYYSLHGAYSVENRLSYASECSFCFVLGLVEVFLPTWPPARLLISRMAQNATEIPPKGFKLTALVERDLTSAPEVLISA